MSNLSEFIGGGGGGKLRFQEFTSSGTFTPSAALLAKGGRVYYELIGGGSSGAIGHSNAAAIGGDAGTYKTGVITLTGAETVTIGAGGAAVSATSTNTAGNAGSQSSIGSLATAAGGIAPPAPTGINNGGGGRGALGLGYFSTDTTYTLDARGGVGVNGRAGGGGGSTPYSSFNYGPWHMRGVDGGGNGAFSTGGAAATATAGTANTGGGGGGASNDYTSGIKTSGAGGSGWCRIVWFE